MSGAGGHREPGLGDMLPLISVGGAALLQGPGWMTIAGEEAGLKLPPCSLKGEMATAGSRTCPSCTGISASPHLNPRLMTQRPPSNCFGSRVVMPWSNDKYRYRHQEIDLPPRHPICALFSVLPYTSTPLLLSVSRSRTFRPISLVLHH